MSLRSLAVALLATQLLGPVWADDLRQQVFSSLQTGVAAWNRGDIDGFMKGYISGPELTYTASGRVVRGSQALRSSYMTSYGSNRDAMGQLRFEDVEVSRLGDDHALALGRWIVEFKSRTPARSEGVFSLVLRREGSSWLIVHDHTSRLEEKK